MMKLTILLVVAIAHQAYCDKPERIVGGRVATPGQFPYQISLQYRGSHICGGSIISNRSILTPAHCVEDMNPNSLSIVTGAQYSSGDGQSHKIKCVRIHPGYSDLQVDRCKHDIAIITPTKPIEFNNQQASIHLASRDYATGHYRGLKSGFGKTSLNSGVSLQLLYTEVNILSNDNCKNMTGAAVCAEGQLCTSNGGICHGDSGGLLVVDNELVGISWVLPCTLGTSDVYTNVYPYLSFIKESQSMC